MDESTCPRRYLFRFYFRRTCPLDLFHPRRDEIQCLLAEQQWTSLQGLFPALVTASLCGDRRISGPFRDNRNIGFIDGLPQDCYRPRPFLTSLLSSVPDSGY